MNLAAIDIQLLRVFDAMFVEASTVRAGQRLGLSQPAVSAALGRLRHIAGDALFVREGNRMVPTSRAVELRQPVQLALEHFETAMAAVAGFDPGRSERTFKILGSDYFSNLLMPRLAGLATPIAPAVRLQMLDHPSAEISEQLRQGNIDVAVAPREATPEWVNKQKLHDSHIVCVARKAHPVLVEYGIKPGQRIPPEVFCQIPQVLMSMDGATRGTMDTALSESGLSRRVVMTVPHFQAVALCVASSAMLGNLPVHFAHLSAQWLGLDIFRPPVDPPIVGVFVYWHRRLDQDPANAWLRGLIVQASDFRSNQKS